MPKEYVFWLKRIERSFFYFDWVGNVPKNLIKVVITESQIKFDSLSEIDSQGILFINLSDITHIRFLTSSTGYIGDVKISTQESNYYLIPVNPLDPTLVLVPSNIDELIAFCSIVEAFKNGQIPDYDENPYVRQFQKKHKPDSLIDNQDVIYWDKNVSPLKYYYEFRTESDEKTSRLMIMIYKTLILSVLILAILLILYHQYSTFQK